MKPDWDKLAKEYDGSETVLIADVDCTSGTGKDVCQKMGVKGYPTIKLFNEGDTEGETYEGGRDLSSLKKAAAALGPSCSVKNYDLCDDKEKAAIDELAKLTPAERLEQIKAAEDAIEALESKFKDDLEDLQATYKQMLETKDTAVDALKKPLKGLKAFKDTAGGDGKDEL
jgi:thioredoxin-like negative regulator of GroEL